MNPMIGPMILTVDKQFLEALEKKLELENRLCDALRPIIGFLISRVNPDNQKMLVDDSGQLVGAFRDWFTYNTRRAIEQAKRGPQDTFRFQPSDEALINAKGNLERAQGKLDAMKRFLEDMDAQHIDAVQIALVNAMVIPDLEAQVELAERTLSMIQKQIEDSST